jgi:hypothetical protein
MRNRPYAVLTFALAALILTLPAAAERPLDFDAAAANGPIAYVNVVGPLEIVQTDGPTGGLYAETWGESRVGDRVLEAGLRVFPGEVVHQGALVNQGEVALTVRLGDGQTARVEPGHGVVVADAQAVAVDADPCDSCSVSCSDGYYSCCNPAGWFSCAKCTCVKNGEEKECQNGGPGSKSCSIGGSNAALSLDVN